MPLSVNSAGTTQADPFLAGLRLRVFFGATNANDPIADLTNVDIAEDAGFTTGVVSRLANTSPAETVILTGDDATYTNGTGRYNIGDTTGLTAGDKIYLAGGGIAAAVYNIASVVDGSNITLVEAPLGADATGISYDVGWKIEFLAGADGSTSNAAGKQNFIRAIGEDASSNAGTASDSIWFRDKDTANDVQLNGGAPTGQTTASASIALAAFASFANSLGVTHLELQAGSDFTWAGGAEVGTLNEQTLADALLGLTASGGDGLKSGTLLAKSQPGSTGVTYPISITIDSTAPDLYILAEAA